MSEAGIGGDDTVAAPSEKPAHVTTKRESDPLVAQPVKRAASASGADDYGDLLPVDPAHYKVIREIARGGMGRILEVRDRRLGRNVAIKEVLVADEAGLARFEREVSITARLQHPAIVHVHEAGRWPDGKPFYVMKLIRGKPLDTRIAKAKSLRERLELLPAVITVVDALAFAHSEQVIHRDLKPANVLVGDFGETIVIDWGIAKAFDDAYEPISIDPDHATKNETIAGAVIGTPSYMPPEQAAGDRVDARADVYSLGAMLYQVLGGKPPFVGRTTAEVLAKVLDEQPPSLAEIDSEIPADLIAIVEKAMARNPADRFPTANEMAVELKRFQQGMLIASRQYTKWELTKRWLYRYRVAVAVGFIAISAFIVGGALAFKDVLEQRDFAAARAREAMTGDDRGKLDIAKRLLVRDPSEALAIVKQLSPGSPEWVGARSIAAEAASRGTADVIVRDSSEVWLLAFSPDGSLLAEFNDSWLLRVWHRPTHTARVYPATRMFAIGFDGNATLVGLGFDQNVYRWDIATGTRTLVRHLGGEIDSAKLSPDGKRILLFTLGEPTRLLDLSSNSEREVGGNYSSGSWAPDGSHALLLIRTNGGRVDRYDLASGELRQIATNLDGEVATDGVSIWGSTWNGQKATLRNPLSKVSHDVGGAPVKALLALPDGRVVAGLRGGAVLGGALGPGKTKGVSTTVDRDVVATDNHAVLVLDASFSAPIELLGHHAPISALAVSPTGELATGDRRGEIRIWHVPPIRHETIKPHAALKAFLSPDHRYLAVGRRGPAFEVHDLQTGSVRTLYSSNYEVGGTTGGVSITRVEGMGIPEEYSGPGDEIVSLAAPASGTRFATVDERNRAVVWDLSKGELVTDNATMLAISPDGRKLVTASGTVVTLWDLEASKRVLQRDLGTEITAVTVNARGSVAVAAYPSRVLFLVADRVVNMPYPTNNTMRVLTFSPDGRQVLGAGGDGAIRIWEIGSDAHRVLVGHTGSVIALAFSPSTLQLASSAGDNDIRIWNLATGTSIVCEGHTDLAPTIRFVDETTVVSSSLDHTARICDTRTGYSRALRGAKFEVIFAAKSGNRFFTVDRFHQIAEHPDNLPHDELLLRAWLDSATNLRK